MLLTDLISISYEYPKMFYCYANTYNITYQSTCIKYVACSFLQNAVKIPVTNNLILKAIDQDTGIDAEINYEMIRGM